MIKVSELDATEIKMPGNVFIDARHLNRIQHYKLYSVVELAGLFSCSEQKILSLCSRNQQLADKKIDRRWVIGIAEECNYKINQVAKLLGCSQKLIYKLRGRGEFQRFKNRIPGWSLIDFIKKNASPATQSHLDNIRISSLIRIPGWTVFDYVIRNCSSL